MQTGQTKAGGRRSWKVVAKELQKIGVGRDEMCRALIVGNDFGRLCGVIGRGGIGR